MYNEMRNGFSKHLDFAAVDLLAMSIALCVSCGVFSLIWDSDNFNQVCIMLFLSGYIGSIVSAMLTKNYQHIVRRNSFEELRYVIRHTIEIALFMLLVTVSLSPFLSQLVLLLIFFIFCNIMIEELSRGAFKRYLTKKYDDIEHYRSIVLVANQKNVEAALDNLLCYKICNYRVTGIVLLDSNEQKNIRGIPVYGDYIQEMNMIKEQVLDEVFVSVDHLDERTEQFVEDCYRMGVAIHYIDNSLIKQECEQINEHLGEYAVTTIALKSVSLLDSILKRILDVIGGLVGIVMTGIILILVTPIIKIQSPGPVLFCQTRVGKNGRKFQMYKIRTMYMDAEQRKQELMAQNEMQGFMFKMKNDPRIFPFGKFLRKTSLDEFPQFWNVLKGNMSLVGTRPPTVDEYEQYETHHKSRLATRPGLTGLWQVSGRNNITDFEEVVALDTQYIQNWSLGLDLKIIFKTFLIVFFRRGAS